MRLKLGSIKNENIAKTYKNVRRMVIKIKAKNAKTENVNKQKRNSSKMRKGDVSGV
jgi:hypothetical protein